MLYYLFGHDKEAVAAINEAVGMAGTQRMKDNARAIRLLISTRRDAPSSEYSAFLIEEMTWLDRKIAEERASSDRYDNHYTDVKERVVYKGLIPLYDNNGNSDMATMLCGMMNKCEADFDKERSAQQNASYSAWNEYFSRLDSLSADRLSSYYRYLISPKQDAFENFVAGQVYLNADYYNDLIGTKMIAEGRFSDAIPYLEKVSLDFLNSQNIAFYAAQRNFNVERWFHRQPLKGDETYLDEAGATRKTLDKNIKLDFCRAVLDLQTQLSIARPDGSREALAYRLATLICQASYYGDCWFLTHYGKSVSDTARIGELDYLARATELLHISKTSNDLWLRYKSLYALASLPLEPWYSTIYDEDYNAILTPRPLARQYKALGELSDFAAANPQYIDRYTTKCDILRRFQTLTDWRK